MERFHTGHHYGVAARRSQRDGAEELADRFFIASAFIEGQALAERLAGQGVEARTAARLVMALANAVDYAHRQAIIRRDVKPGNTLVDAAEEPLLTDFGLARFLESNEQLTQDGVAVGTPAYMPPEQVRGEQQTLGPVADQYSLGVQ
ncbi:MAG: protein kinase [Pirellulales bacterium]|nr:protein kinase [Pirellulales bacterium]